MDNEQEPDPDSVEEPSCCHTWLHIGGPLDGQVRFYGDAKSPPEEVIVAWVLQPQPQMNAAPDNVFENTPVMTSDSAYVLERIHCGQALTVYRFAELTVTEMFTKMLRNYSPGTAGTRAKMLDQMGRGVKDSELHAYVAGGFGIREMMTQASQLREHVRILSQRAQGPPSS